jgi:ubiquinol-cytochrome c reductase cytochrome c1 subunit
MMKRYLLFITVVVLSGCYVPLFAAEVNVEGLQLATAPVNINDVDSIKRGAKFFATTCMACHTLSYLRYDKIAKEAGIDPNKKPIVLNGVVPPDLSLEADVHGPDWIYTYLHSFYKDKGVASGVNNLIFPGTAMPAILAPYQGEQILVNGPSRDLLGHLQWYDMLKPVTQGSMSGEEFDNTVTDLVNFLVYAAGPFRAEQEHLGYWVLGFLALLFVLTYYLKKEYWKDVKKSQE